MHYNASSLRERVQVLACRHTEAVGWSWELEGKAWAQVEVSGKRNLFSSVGLGAKSAALVLRDRPLTLHNAILWRGQHLLLTGIEVKKQGWLDVTAAQVEITQCRAEPPTGEAFPGVLTEKHITHQQLEPMATNAICYVLVTPKAVVLRPGKLVEVAGTVYHILLRHELDPYKNEYEIMRTVDL